MFHLRDFFLLPQVVMVLGASLGHLGIAIVAAWPNPAVPDLKRHNSTVYGTPITLTSWQIDMLGELLYFFHDFAFILEDQRE